jgi:uncharacterized protein (DUF427 family)
MSDKPIKIPGPDHPITITPFDGKVVVRAAGQVIAETTSALTLQEAGYAPVYYIPRSDADMKALEPSQHETYCPYKGDANYFSLPSGDAGRNGVWTYETPYSAVADIKDHLAFYRDKVEIEIRA